MSESTRETRLETIRKELRAVIVHMRQEQLGWCDITAIIQRTVIQKALSDSRGNQTRAASSLGIHRNTLNRIAGDLGLRKSPARERRQLQRLPALSRVSAAAVIPQLRPDDRRLLDDLERESYPRLRRVEAERDYPTVRKPA
jgi:DNA-binding protein Fis